MHCGRSESALANGSERNPIFWALVLFLCIVPVCESCSVAQFL